MINNSSFFYLVLEVCTLGNGEVNKEQVLNWLDQLVAYSSNGSSNLWRKPAADWNRATLTSNNKYDILLMR